MTPAVTRPDNRQVVWDTTLRRHTRGIPAWMLHVMDHSHLERLAGAPPGSYRRAPARTYVAAQRAVGACFVDQYIPENPLTMDPEGWKGPPGATTGSRAVAVDGMTIAGPDDVAAHLETVEFPRLRAAVAAFDADAYTAAVLEGERAVQQALGPDILKAPYGVCSFPCLAYGTYGYEPYFTAWALYPDLMEMHFRLQADLSVRVNAAAAQAYAQGGLLPLCRLDHDMADSRGTLAGIRSLDRLWFPHFSRCLQPLLDAGLRLIWHCDGNLMEMAPRLLECGLAGFQGFQYEDGMDYERICRMRTRDGDTLLIVAGVSVTRTLPFGTPADVKRELEWLVRCGPPVGLFLGASSSITPGVPWENLCALVDGLRWYREHGRD